MTAAWKALCWLGRGVRFVFMDRWGFRPAWTVGGCIVVGLTLLIGGIGVAVNFFGTMACERSAEKMGLEGDYDFWAGETCFVVVDGETFPLDQLRASDEVDR